MKSPTIKKRSKQANLYSELQDTTIKRISELSGNLWTDYNEHDPGITIADYTNFGLFDLHFRQLFSLEEYLFKNNEKVDHAKKGLFYKEQLYTRVNAFNQEVARKSMVTESDYEAFFLETFHQDLSTCSVRLNSTTKKYDLFLTLIDRYRNDTIGLELALKQKYHKHRNLGENIGVIHFDDHLPLNKNAYADRKSFRKYNYDFPLFNSPNNPVSQKRFKPDYASIQYDFPETYGIGSRGIPSHDDPNYRKKVLQLKGYLLLFDYMMADQFNQMGAIHQVFDLNRALPIPSLPTVAIVDAEVLIDEQRKEIQTHKIEADHFFANQRFRYLNLLDALYNENTRQMFGNMDIEVLNEKRMQLLKILPFINEKRFQSFDVYQPNSMGAIHELAEEILAIRFSDSLQHRSQVVKVITDEVFEERYSGLHVTFPLHLEEIPAGEHLPLETADRSLEHMKEVLTLIWQGVIPESIMELGTDLTHYYLTAIDQEYFIVFVIPETEVKITLSLLHADKNRLIEELYTFLFFLKKLKRFGFQQHLYFVEHVLMKDTPIETPSPDLKVPPSMEDVKNANLISIVFPKIGKGTQLEDWLTEWLEERLPAHINFKLYGLESGALENFHVAYYDWRKALAADNRELIIRKSQALKFFFQYAKENKPQQS